MTGAAELALLGGAPLRSAPWPVWPPVTEAIRQAALAALESGRWAISGPHRGRDLAQRRFERAWADYCGVAHAVAVSSGSSALVLALEALEIGPGDEVIVPVWTWVATASTVLRVGATPVLVDVADSNFCIDPAAVAAAVTPRTKAIIAVHLHHSMADLEALLVLARRNRLFLIEDAAQAHGALYGAGRAGSFGDIAAFSFQQTKVLTSGEGGAVVTNDRALAERVFELHADGRRWQDWPDPVTGLQLADGSGPMGANHGLTEFQAAILLAQLPDLDERLETTAGHAALLDTRLAALGPLVPLVQPARLTRRTVFEYLIGIDPALLGDIPIALVGAALSAELGLAWYPSDPPLHRSGLYRPASKRRFALAAGAAPSSATYPVATRQAACSLACHHAALLADADAMADIVRAFDKLLTRLDRLRAFARRQQPA